ncbi:proline-tRNA ligase (DUF1680) [Citrus sinensis]|uniref:Proline-tRNA ligase (DUF1680) n=1 Tax=Citrus sinensis TaxID=2711 RepID=A0ACB8MVR2_CITSI|nr:proline-tRNA ligase (DUF1680) [Citrus sinensis]KAH9789651.1 proline-tRNA ligase (DUF1680) [Citrus sinensis]
MSYRKIKNPGEVRMPGPGEFLKEVSLHDVLLENSQFANAGKPYGGWEDPICEFRGHFVVLRENAGSGVRSVRMPESNGKWILAGLLDEYAYADKAEALKITTWMVDSETLQSETYFYCYHSQQDPKHLVLVHLFDKPCSLGLLAVQADDISGFCAKTKIPIVIGSQMRYEVTGDQLQTVSRNLFRWTKEMAYADYYEPSGSTKDWGTPFDSLWGCYGTGLFSPSGLQDFILVSHVGIQSFAKLGDSIYFEEEGLYPGLYIIQYISSSLDWKSGHIVLNQKVDPVVSSDPYLHITFTFLPKGAARPLSFGFRISSWTNTNGAKATLNGQDLPLPSTARTSDDKLTIQLPLILRIEPIDEFQLVTFSKVSRNSTFVLTIYPNGKSSKSGTDIALQATFRFILNDKPSSEFSSLSDVIGRSVMLELFASPGMLVVRGTDDELVVTDSSSVHGSSIFRLVTRWDGKAETVSLESVTQKGCFVSTSVNLKSGASMKLSCNTESTEVGFNNAASFAMEKELSIILSTLLQREQRGIFFWCHY